MFEAQYRKEMDRVTLSEEQTENIIRMMEQEEAQSMKRVRKAARMTLIAAALCVLLVVSVSAAALLGVFDFLKKQDNFSLLGMTEVYEKYAYDVGLSATTGNGDVFTLEKVAMDGTFCTIFYAYHYSEPLMTWQEFSRLDTADPWTTYHVAPIMSLFLNGEDISTEGYQNSFEVQQYLSDEHTVYGAWRCLLTAPFWDTSDGTELELRGYTFDLETEDRQDFSLAFLSHPNAAAVNYLHVTFPMTLGGQTVPVEAVSLHHSPLGTLLTLRHERVPSAGPGLLKSFVLRDKDTGEYIPFARIWTRGNGSGAEEEEIYELFGDLDGLSNLELIPTWSSQVTHPRKAVSLSELPTTDSGNEAGGYAPASYRAKDGRLVVEMKPVEAVTADYPALSNGVYFLDKDGNELFRRSITEKFKNRLDGTITVVTVVDPEEFQRDVDKVATIWFFEYEYSLLKDRAVTLPVPIHIDFD